MTRKVMLDGQLVDEANAKVSVFDRGFLYGDAVFETIRTYGGRPFELAQHLNRLKWSADRVFIPLPVDLSTLTSEVEQCLAAAANPESYVRLMVTRGVGAMGLDPSTTERPLRVIIVDQLQVPLESEYERGIAVITFQTQRFGDSTAAAGAKVANYLVAVLAMREARRVGAAEALISDHTGNIVEGCTSNVFAVSGSKLVTPPESAGILPGVTRARVLRAASELGLAVEYAVLNPEQVFGSNELFICSSLREVLPVVRVDGRPIGEGRPGAITRQLLSRFRENVRRDMSLT